MLQNCSGHPSCSHRRWAWGTLSRKKLNWLSNEDLEACGYLSKTDAATKEIILKREPISRFEDIKGENESVSLIRIAEIILHSAQPK